MTCHPGKMFCENNSLLNMKTANLPFLQKDAIFPKTRNVCLLPPYLHQLGRLFSVRTLVLQFKLFCFKVKYTQKNT